MGCSKCGAAIEAAEWAIPTRGAAAAAILKDWRTWAVAFATFAIVGVLANALGRGGGTGAGAGGAVGLMVALRMTRLRSCPRCHAVVSPG